jgi:hypothetical protein
MRGFAFEQRHREARAEQSIGVLRGLAVALIRIRIRAFVMFGLARSQYGLPSASLGSGAQEEQR